MVTKGGLPSLEEARQLAKEFARVRDLREQVAPFAQFAWDGRQSPTTLHIDDFSAIPFLVDIAGAEEYQHRSRVRAGDGHIFATTTPATEGYASYCETILRIGRPTHIVAEPVNGPLQVTRACRTGAAFDALVSATRNAGGLMVHPYMGIEEVWALAADLHRKSGCPVKVIAPPPPVTWVANDKSVFDDLVKHVLGPQWLVETIVHTDPSQMARALLDLASRHRQVGLKRTRCASAMGNAVFLSTELLTTPHTALDTVLAFLNRTEWPGEEEVLAVAWVDTDLSPSTQLWIPPLGSGDPRLDGIYEQILAGERKVFVGSRPSTLPDTLNQQLGDAALRVGAALQELGYVGRCSFDHLVVGETKGSCQVLFTECNGRWGGTSTPMSLLDRLYDDARPPYRAQDVVYPELVGGGLHNLLNPVKDLLFDSHTGQGRFIFYNVGPIAKHGKFDVISIGQTQDDAERGISEILPSRLGL